MGKVLTALKSSVRHHVVMLFLLPGAGGAALFLADVAPRNDFESFLMRWWPTLMLVGVFIAWRYARSWRP